VVHQGRKAHDEHEYDHNESIDFEKQTQEFIYMKSKPFIALHNQRGSVINVALLILILIFLVGIGLNKISTTDVKIASNMKTQATTFYEAEAGLDAAGELIEQNLACGENVFTTDGQEIAGYFYVNKFDFGYNRRNEAFIPSITSDADFYYPLNYGDETAPHTSVKVGGVTRLAKGSAIQMSAGYEGLGKGTAEGSGSILFDVYVRRIGANNSSATHFMQWSHEIDYSEDKCKLD